MHPTPMPNVFRYCAPITTQEVSKRLHARFGRNGIITLQIEVLHWLNYSEIKITYNRKNKARNMQAEQARFCFYFAASITRHWVRRDSSSFWIAELFPPNFLCVVVAAMHFCRRHSARDNLLNIFLIIGMPPTAEKLREVQWYAKS